MGQTQVLTIACLYPVIAIYCVIVFYFLSYVAITE